MPARRRGRSCFDFFEANISRRDLYFNFIRILNSVQAAGRWVGSLDLSKIAPLVLTTILEHKAGCSTRTKVVSSGSFTLLDSITCF